MKTITCWASPFMNLLRMAATKVIIDTDPGTDDALALFMALEAHRRGCVQVLAITTVHGNTSIENANNNVLRILRLTDSLDIPVYSGASRPLVHLYIRDEEPFHGQDGFGDADLPPQPPAASLLQPQHAVTALLDLASRHSGEVVLMGLGPLTNLALAMRLDPAFTSHLAGLYIMGGNSSGVGNITPFAEFNFYCDTDAAFIVLEEAGIPIRLTPFEICLKDGAIPYSVRQELGRTKTAAADLMNKIEVGILKQKEYASWVTCDQMAMAWFIDEAKNKRLEGEGRKENGLEAAGGFLEERGKPLVTLTKSCYATVNTKSELTDGRMMLAPERGQMVVDHEDRLGLKHNVVLLEGVDTSVYMKYLKMAFGADI